MDSIVLNRSRLVKTVWIGEDGNSIWGALFHGHVSQTRVVSPNNGGDATINLGTG
ncbi:hypothetical protein Pan241w_56380 [Gimesia alba]|uniref:Uncharacterized protein n=1 Tax=Gimesia alba TaxID=2527973 RepID=A0A517RNP7_9PLAN|nr:hypothetical protein Pan241w_56380 [Gimesia alba]